MNFSKDYTYAIVDVGVSYDANLDEVYRVLETIGRTLHADLDDVLEPTTVDGLTGFGESDLPVRTITRVRPGRHGAISRELRRRVKSAFDAAGIEIPYARRVVIFKNDHDAPTLPK